MRSWSQALALAPMVLGVVACSGTDAANDAGAEPTDAADVVRDSGSIADAGFADAAVRDAGPADTGVEPDAGNPACSYPPGAVEPMALDEVITPYSWPLAIHGAGQRFDLDLTQVHCANDPDIDWSPFDVLLFVSIPAW